MNSENFITTACASVNAFVLGVTSVRWDMVLHVELVLKIVLLLVTIGYTSYMWRKASKKKDGQ